MRIGRGNLTDLIVSTVPTVHMQRLTRPLRNSTRTMELAVLLVVLVHWQATSVPECSISRACVATEVLVLNFNASSLANVAQRAFFCLFLSHFRTCTGYLMRSYKFLY